MTSVLPTESDGEWIGEALHGILPEEMDGKEWVQLDPTEYEGHLTNQFVLRSQNLVVLARVSPLYVQGTEDKYANYHVVTYRREGGKVKKPTAADVTRVRRAFFLRELAPSEVVYEGTVGDSRAHHFITRFPWKPQIIVE